MAFNAPQSDLEQTGFEAPDADIEPIGFSAPESDLAFTAPESEVAATDEDAPGLIDYGAAFATDIAISEAGRLGGAALGTAILPGIGTGIGYVVGGLGAGAAGSIARQRLLDPDGELSYGQIFADALINLIPGAKGGKSVATAVARQAGVGAGISAGGKVVESVIDDGNLPTLEELSAAGLTGAALGGGLGISGAAFSKAYAKFGGLPSRNLTEAFRIGDPDATLIVNGVQKTGEEYAEMLPKTFDDLKLGIKEAYSDELIRARVLQSEVAGGQIKDAGPLKVKSDDTDFYLQRRIAEGKIDARNEEIEKLLNLDEAFLISKAKELDGDPADLSRAINEYLYAKHGIAYNKANAKAFGGDGAAGRSTDEFRDIVKQFEARGFNKQLSHSINTRKDLSKRILDTLEDGGLVSKKVANELREKFPDYVPLNRIMDSDELGDVTQRVLSSSGRYETTSSGLRKAKGSERDVRAISQNIVDNLISATRRAEINKTNQAFVRLLRDNPNAAKEIATVKKFSKRDDALTVFEDGKKLFVEFKDPALAAAMKGQNKEVVGGILRGFLGINRFLGGLYTRFNPEFLVPNLVRDRSEAFVNNLAKMSLPQAAKTLDPISTVRDDMAAIRRNLTGKRAPAGSRAAKMDALYDEFVKAGGRTGGLGLSTLKDVEKNLERLSGKLNQPTKSKAKAFNGFINGVNELFENSTRFATYRRARADGMSPDKAALAARNSSFDPRLQGAQGDTLRALYLFSNPAIQGAKNFIRSMWQNKLKVGVPVMATLTSTMYILDKYNKTIDEDWRKKVPEFKTNKNIVIVKGQKPDGTLDYFSVPIGYSMVPFKIAADFGQRVLFGGEEIDPKLAGVELADNIIDSYNPMGGSPVPTVFRPILELSRNKDGLGRDIRPEWLETSNMSETVKIKPWTARTRGGELAMNFAEQLEDLGYEVSPENLLYLYQNYTGGPGTTVKRLFNATSKLWNGEKIPRSEIPILRRFYGETYAQAFERRTGKAQSLESIQKQENTNAQRSRLVADNYKTKFKNAGTTSEKRDVLQAMLADPKADESVVRRVREFVNDEAAGITPADRRLKSESTIVRAKYLTERIQDMDRDEAIRYLGEMESKGILSQKVKDQMVGIEAFRSFFAK